MFKKLFTSESVSCGHPDKVADQISDAILDVYLERDADARVAVETLVTEDNVVVAGEVSSSAVITAEETDAIIRDTIREIGYDKDEYRFNADTVKITNFIHTQSPDIAMGVDDRNGLDRGAGDQGIMFGYACNETPSYMPLTIDLANRFVRKLEQIRREGKVMTYLRPDAKSQVTVEYGEDGKPIAINTILVSTQHDEFAVSDKEMQERIYADVKSILIPAVVVECSDEVQQLFGKGYTLIVNPTGRFVLGGPAGDTGLTGRKIIVDTYGGHGAHGGGAFCVDGETEYLSPDGWKRISEYDGGQVAQWDDYEVSFVKPFAYYKNPAEKMYRIYSPHAYDMVLSEHHDVVFETSKGNIVKKQVKDIVDPAVGGIRNENFGSIPVSFTMKETGKGVNLTDDQIRLQVAFCADGTLKAHTPNIRIKKQYKIDRLLMLLKNTNTEYRDTDGGDGARRYKFIPPIQSKSLVECFKNASLEQMRVIAEELPQWDGNRDNVFRTTIKEDADFAQFIFMVAYGTRASIVFDDRLGETREMNGKVYEYKNILYEVYRLKYQKTSFRHGSKLQITAKEVKTNDGMMYCFTVPSGKLLLRRNNHVFVTGNCGKDPSKVDRAGAYAARHIAKNLVAAGVCDKVLIQVSYAIGMAEPISVAVNTYGTAKNGLSDETIAEIVYETFDLRPVAIEKRLKLRHPIYHLTASQGHFGHEPGVIPDLNPKFGIGDGVDTYTWEKLDYVDELKRRCGIK